MKEYKKSYNLKEDIDKETEKRFNEELNEIKEKLNSEKLSDEFKTNLQNNLQQELNKTEDSTKGKIFKFPIITRKLAGICACFVFLFSSCFAFADDIENVILELFGNTDKVIAKAIAEGNYKEVDMEYVEDNGVSIKVDYVVIEDNEMYIAFNVLTDEALDRILFGDIIIKNENDFLVYTGKGKVDNSKFVFEKSHIDLKNLIVIYKLTDMPQGQNKVTSLKFEINSIYCVKNKLNINKNGIWNFEISL